MSFEQLGIYVLASLLIGSIPGPSVWFAITSSLQMGVRKTLFTIFGQLFGNVFHIMVVVLGLGALVESGFDVLIYLKYIGATYLLHMAFRLYFTNNEKTGGDSVLQLKSNKRLFWEGFIVCISNPKLFIHFLVFLPQFVDPAGSKQLQLLILGSLNIPIGFLILYIYAMGADFIKKWLSEEFAQKYLNKVSAGIVALVAILLLSST